MDNSVSRLLKILERAKELKGTNPCIQNWKELFNAREDYEVPEKIGSLLTLSGVAARQVVALHPDCIDGVIYWQSRLTSALSSASLKSEWSEFFKYIDGHAISYLRMQAKLVDNERRSTLLEESRLNDARIALHTALDEISSSNLSNEAKIILLDRVRSLIAAIENYAIFGQDAIFDLLKATAFDIGSLREAGQDIPKSGALREGLSILADLMTVASSIPALAPPALALLERIVQ
jgi:hypothetical protein